jgi:hypothetical protein
MLYTICLSFKHFYFILNVTLRMTASFKGHCLNQCCLVCTSRETTDSVSVPLKTPLILNDICQKEQELLTKFLSVFQRSLRTLLINHQRCSERWLICNNSAIRKRNQNRARWCPRWPTRKSRNRYNRQFRATVPLWDSRNKYTKIGICYFLSQDWRGGAMKHEPPVPLPELPCVH